MSGLVIPTIETARLRLRRPALADFPAFEQIMMSDRAKYMGGPFDRWGAWGMFCHDIASWDLFGHGGLMVVRHDGVCVGEVSINHGPLFPEKELGWMLYHGFEGKGYATEAAAAFRDWAFATLRLPSLVSYFDPANTRSIAVAVRLGAMRDDDAPRQDAEDLVYRHHRPV
ncbi:acetyltransferase [Devosia sp. Root413D1]|uniref:GNAT family N-acetyltransferase n=1 Tax=Devosia sp. LjRoot16 TaxID=3342271 RepID=UPI0006FBB359|nr:acetyltransferase [Devosia sp. Root413D1]